MLENAATGVGAASLAGGTVRHMYMFISVDNKVYPSLVVETLRVAQSQRAILIRGTGASNTASIDLHVGSLSVPLNGDGSMRLSIELALKRALARPGDAPAIPAAKDEQFAVLRAAFIPWLARIDVETNLPRRRVARRDEFPQHTRGMVERLIEARLLVADRRSGADIVELAHESLLRQWPALAAWLQADAEDLKRIEAVERAAAEWVRNGRHEAWLDHRAERLRAAERAATRDDFRNRLGEDGVAYLNACGLSVRRRTRIFRSRACWLGCPIRTRCLRKPCNSRQLFSVSFPANQTSAGRRSRLK